MRVTFWGTRGSLAKPGPETLRYGGNTACVQVETAGGTLIVLDCGTGVHALGQHLMARQPQPRRGCVLISHTHWDHIQGLPFFAPLFVPGHRWDVYGPGGLAESIRETLAGQMQYSYFPITLDAMAADVRYHSLVEGVFEVDGVRVRTRYLNHPTLTLGYRLEVDGAVLVYACDHEPYSNDFATEGPPITGQDRAHVDFLRGADLVIHDAQYTDAEYADKVGWGHSPLGYAVRVCQAADVKRLAVTHHDPLRGDDSVDRVISAVREGLQDGRSELEVFAAAEGLVVELAGGSGAEPAVGSGEGPSALRSSATPEAHRILVAMAPGPDAERVVEAAATEDVDVVLSSDGDDVVQRYREAPPSLLIVDGPTGGVELCRTIRALGDGSGHEVPFIVVAPRAGDDEAATDWLTAPFSTEYARTRIRAWLMRVESRWARPPMPADEAARVEALRELGILDTEAEERFDRITRLAAAVLGAPISLLSLVDADRQWFKSRIGLDVPETSREASFCAHAIVDHEPFIVSDTLLDGRFADNPLVTGPPHVRFYAGCPLELPNGHAVGTLCVIDARARELTPEQIALLKDLAQLAEEELARVAAKASSTG